MCDTVRSTPLLFCLYSNTLTQVDDWHDLGLRIMSV